MNPPTSLTSYNLLYPPIKHLTTSLASFILLYPPLKDLVIFTLTALSRLATYPSLIQQASYNSKLNQKGLIKLTKNTLIAYLIGFFAFSSIASLFLFNPFGTKETQATWFNDNWAYRKEVPITANAAADTDAFFSFTLDTATLITAGQLQSSCQDIRVTDVNGNLLQYHVGRTNACNNAATTIDVLPPYASNSSTPTLPAGASTFYVYYGNPSVTSTDRGSNFTQSEAASYTVGTLGSAVSGPAPTLYWKFDDGQGTTANDSTINALSGTLGGSIGVSSGGPTNIDNASDFGAIVEGARPVVRTSSGTLYAFIYDAPNCEVWKSTNGTSWTEQDSINHPECSGVAGIAIDSNDTLHLLYEDSVRYEYRSFSSDTYGIEETVFTTPSVPEYADIAVDSSNKPHVVLGSNNAGDPSTTHTIRYTNRVSGSWKTTVLLESLAGASGTQTGVGYPAITISEDNIPEIAYLNLTDADLTAAVGNVNDAASFTLQDVDISINVTTSSLGASIAVDSSGNTWIGYTDATGINQITLVKHNDADAWSTWQTPVTNSNVGNEPSIAINGTDIYVFYEDSADDDIKYDRYNGSTWLGETSLHTGTFLDAKVKWAYYFNNQGSTQLDYLYSDGIDIYWASLGLSTATSTPDWKSEDLCLSGKCLYFDGTNADTVIKSDDSKLDYAATDNMTVSGWVKRNGVASANSVILQKTGANIGATYTGYKIYMDASGDLCFDIQDGTNAVDSACTSAVDFDDDQWHFVSGVKAATTSITLYVDGNKRAEDLTIASTGTLANASSFIVGLDSDGSSNKWKGYIDEVKVFRDNAARTAAQVKADYNARSNPEGLSSQTGNNTQNLTGALSNGLVGYWKMDESSWTVNCATESVLDSSGNSNDGAACPNATGPAGGANGKYGNSGDFDGSNDYVDIDNTASLQNTRYTHSFWMYADNASGTGTYEDVIGSNDAGQTSVNYAFQWSSANGASYQKTCMQKGNAGPYELAQISSTMSAGTWYFVTCSYDGTNLKAYLNGKLEASVAGTNPNVANPIQIGADGVGSNNFNGKVDEFRIYNRALTNAEVSQLYNWAPGPVGYWKIDEGTGTQLMDSSGYGNNSTSPWTGSGITWTGGKYGKGLNYPDSNHNSVVRIPEGTSLDLGNSTSSFTVESFFNIPSGVSQPSGGGYVLTKFSAAGDLAFLLNIVSTNQLQFEVNGGIDYIAAATVTVSDGKWHHFVGVRDIGTSQLRLYLDGILLDTQTSVTAQDARNDDDISIGNGSSSYTSQDFNGNIDDVKIYNYVRTPAQIIEDLNAGHPAPGSPVGTPVGFWKFNEGADNTCSGGTNDVCNSGSSGSAFDGTSTATRTNSGKLSRALDFDGTDDVVTITNAAGIDLNDNLANFTFSSWVYPDSDGEADTGQVFNKGANTYLRVDSQGTTDLDLECNLDLATTDANVNVADALTTSTWAYVACSWDGTTMSLYVNGLLRGSSASGSGAIAADANNLLIGGGTSNNFDGKIDEFKVYNSALTASQIALDANSASAQVLGATGDNSTAGAVSAESQEYCIPGDSSTCTSPVLKWELETGTGTTIFDTSGSGKTGTLNGTSNVTWSPNGKIGKGINFNGATSTSQNLTTNTTYTPPTTVTIEAWVYSKGSGANTIGQIFKTFNGTSTGYFLVQNSTTCYRFRSAHATAGQWYTPTGTVTPNTWQHIAVTYDAGSLVNVPSIYINGQLQTLDGTCVANVTPVGAWTSSAGTWTVGGDSTSVNTYNGIIDHVMIFDYQRTAAQIAYDYNRGAPIAHWKMDECQGTVINDMSGFSNTGTLTIGATGTYTTPGTCPASSASSAWYNGATGKRNYSMAFDGTDDYVSVSSSTSLNPTEDITLSAWVKPAVIDSANREIIFKGTTTNNTTRQYGIRIVSGNVWGGALAIGSTEHTVQGTATPVAGTWYHVLMVRTGTTLNLYVNGLLAGTTTSVSGSINTTANALAIGRIGAANAEYFNGLIDDARVYNYALTATQVKSLYNDGATRYGPVTGAP